jgi:glutathione synthase/RimK-type ligase-like ATP-grasp enzyme
MDLSNNSVDQELPAQKEIKLVEVDIVDENIALNVMVSFLSLANKRGAFTIDESAKIWECINKFKKTP